MRIFGGGREPGNAIAIFGRFAVFALARAGIALVTAFALIGGTKPAIQPTQVVQAAASIVFDGSDLAGAMPNCKAVMLAAKGVKGTGEHMDAAKPTEHASWLDKPIMSDKEWAAFQRDMSRQNLEPYESKKEVDDARKRVQHIERITDRDRFEGRAPLR